MMNRHQKIGLRHVATGLMCCVLFYVLALGETRSHLIALLAALLTAATLAVSLFVFARKLKTEAYVGVVELISPFFRRWRRR